MSEELRIALEALEWMLGDWQVVGVIDGQPVSGRAQVRRGVEGSVLEARERILRADGELDYEDLAIYCWDADVRALRVYHFAAPAQLERYTALPLDGRPGIHWIRNDLAARVVMVPTEQGWSAEVWVGGEREPISTLYYSPASSPSVETNQPCS